MKKSTLLSILVIALMFFIGFTCSCTKDERFNWSYTQQWTCTPNKCRIDIFEITGPLKDLTEAEMSYVLDTAKWERYVKTIKDTIAFASHYGEVKLIYFIRMDSVLVKSEIIKIGKRVCI